MRMGRPHAKGTINNNNIFFCKSYRSSGIPDRHPGWTLTKRMIQCIKSNLQRILVMSEGRPLAKHTYICCDIFCKWNNENSSLRPNPRIFLWSVCLLVSGMDVACCPGMIITTLQKILVMSEGRTLAKPTYIC